MPILEEDLLEIDETQRLRACSSASVRTVPAIEVVTTPAVAAPAQQDLFESYLTLLVPAEEAVDGVRDAPLPEAEDEPDEPLLAPLVTVVSASGGTGRSTIALMCAYLAAESGIPTTLIEGDLQFGDFSSWLGLGDELPHLGAEQGCDPIDLGDGLELYRAPALPELAEDVSDDVARQLPLMREGRGLAIADTGGFWSGATAQLLQRSDLFLLVVDARPGSLQGAVKACELCARLGVPRARMVVVYNRWQSRAMLSAEDVRDALHVAEVVCIPEGKHLVGELLGAGKVDELVKTNNATVKGMHALLSEILPRLGYLYAHESAQGRKGLFR